MKIAIIVQARTQSTRLPGKTMLDVLGKPVISRQLERIRKIKNEAEIIVATTKDKSDDAIINICKQEDYRWYRGSTNDLLDRHYRASKEINPDAIVKIPSDCPIIDPFVIDRIINYYIDNSSSIDYISNLHPATYPDGNDVEIMPFQILEKAWKEAEKDYELEHTTPYIWDNPDKFRIGNVVWETGMNYSLTHRFTIDYLEDYYFIKKVFDMLYHQDQSFNLNQIIQLLEEYPEIHEINSKYLGVNWYRNHIGQLNTISLNQTKII